MGSPGRRDLLLGAVALGVLLGATVGQGTAGAPTVLSSLSERPGAVLGAHVPSPSPSASRTVTRPSASLLPVVQRGDGRPAVVPGTGTRSGRGPLARYTVAVEGGLQIDARSFARAVEQTLADARSWGAGGRRSFQRVDRGAVAFRVVLASPDTTDHMCRPLRTAGTYSCANGDSAVVNARRWQRGAEAYAGDLAGYRAYVVNHEVGHTLGHGHRSCPSRGRLAPVMLQQTKGLQGCRKNPWPWP